MTLKTLRLQIAADLLKLMVTINTAVIAGVLVSVVENEGQGVGLCWAMTSIGLGGLTVFACLLYLSDIAANSLGAVSEGIKFQRRAFLVASGLFYVSILCGAVYVLMTVGIL